MNKGAISGAKYAGINFGAIPKYLIDRYPALPKTIPTLGEGFPATGSGNVTDDVIKGGQGWATNPQYIWGARGPVYPGDMAISIPLAPPEFPKLENAPYIYTEPPRAEILPYYPSGKKKMPIAWKDGQGFADVQDGTGNFPILGGSLGTIDPLRIDGGDKEKAAGLGGVRPLPYDPSVPPSAENLPYLTGNSSGDFSSLIEPHITGVWKGDLNREHKSIADSLEYYAKMRKADPVTKAAMENELLRQKGTVSPSEKQKYKDNLNQLLTAAKIKNGGYHRPEKGQVRKKKRPEYGTPEYWRELRGMNPVDGAIYELDALQNEAVLTEAEKKRRKQHEDSLEQAVKSGKISRNQKRFIDEYFYNYGTDRFYR